MKVLNIGSLNLDHVYNVDHILMPGETESSSSLNHFLGGKGMNQSTALAKAGDFCREKDMLPPGGGLPRRHDWPGRPTLFGRMQGVRHP